MSSNKGSFNKTRRLSSETNPVIPRVEYRYIKSTRDYLIIKKFKKLSRNINRTSTLWPRLSAPTRKRLLKPLTTASILTQASLMCKPGSSEKIIKLSFTISSISLLNSTYYTGAQGTASVLKLSIPSATTSRILWFLSGLSSARRSEASPSIGGTKWWTGTSMIKRERPFSFLLIWS